MTKYSIPANFISILVNWDKCQDWLKGRHMVWSLVKFLPVVAHLLYQTWVLIDNVLHAYCAISVQQII